MKNAVFVSSLMLLSLIVTPGFSQSDSRAVESVLEPGSGVRLLQQGEIPGVVVPQQSPTPILEWQGDGELPSYPPASVMEPQLVQPALPGVPADEATETLMESESQSPYEFDSLEPTGPASPKMDFPYRQPAKSRQPGQLNGESSRRDLPNGLPQNSLKPTLPTLPTSKPTLGVMGHPVEGWGFAVRSVVPGSPAARMRLEPGDVILSVNGARVCSADSITSQLLHSSDQQRGTGILLIDNVRFRNNVTVQTCRGSYSRPSKMRFQKIRFQL